jgi:iron-sulfur cluster assembly protein
MPVTITDSAARQISEIIDRESSENNLDASKVCLRVGVKGGGCSGFSYILDLTETLRDSDEVWEQVFRIAAPLSASSASGGGTAVAAPEREFRLKVVCDPKSYLYLENTVIDYKDEGVLKRGFVFNNPNATSSCGCGSSFSA